MVLPCTSELCNYISYQVEMVRAQSTNQFIGSITTVARHVFVRKQWHVTSHVSEVAWMLAVLSFSHVQIEIVSFCTVNCAIILLLHSKLCK